MRDLDPYVPRDRELSNAFDASPKNSESRSELFVVYSAVLPCWPGIATIVEINMGDGIHG